MVMIVAVRMTVVPMRMTMIVMGMVVVAVLTGLTPRDGKYTTPQHTTERCAWRTKVFRWLKSRHDSIFDRIGHGGQVSSGSFREDWL